MSLIPGQSCRRPSEELSQSTTGQIFQTPPEKSRTVSAEFATFALGEENLRHLRASRREACVPVLSSLFLPALSSAGAGAPSRELNGPPTSSGENAEESSKEAPHRLFRSSATRIVQAWGRREHERAPWTSAPRYGMSGPRGEADANVIHFLKGGRRPAPSQRAEYGMGRHFRAGTSSRYYPRGPASWAYRPSPHHVSWAGANGQMADFGGGYLAGSVFPGRGGPRS